MTGTAQAADMLKTAYKQMYNAGDEMINAAHDVEHDNDLFDAIIRIETQLEDLGCEIMKIVERIEGK
jgi:hypothetical protein